MITVLGEHFLSFLLDLCAALVAAWIFLKYYPRLSDYRAQRSIVTARNRVALLENRLAAYERDFSDTRLFAARLVKEGLFVLLYFLFFVMFMLALADMIAEDDLLCRLQNCEHGFWIISRAAFSRQIPVLALIGLISVAMFASLGRFLLEASPEQYKSRLNERIENLRKRTSNDLTPSPGS